MHRMRKLSLWLVPTAIVGGLWAGNAGASPLHVVSTGHATGHYALANASGQINKPYKIVLIISSKPELSGLVQWTVECEKNNKIIPSKRYKKTLKYPATVVVNFTTSSSLCVVAANAQLYGTGTVTVSLESGG